MLVGSRSESRQINEIHSEAKVSTVFKSNFRPNGITSDIAINKGLNTLIHRSADY